MATMVKVAMALALAMAVSATVTNYDVAAPVNIKNRQMLDPPAVYGSIIAARACYLMTYRAAFNSLSKEDYGAVIRLAFHDAGTYDITDQDDLWGGANGSPAYEPCPKCFPPSGPTSGPCPGFIQQCGRIAFGVGLCTKLRDQLRADPSGACRRLTLADTIQIMGAAAVAKAGGPTCELYMGRKDSTTFDKHVANLPSSCADVYKSASLPFPGAPQVAPLVHTFAKMGFKNSENAAVILSGSHNIGNQSAAGVPCAKGVGAMTASPHTFDGHYYVEVHDQVGNKGWFNSDRALMNKKPVGEFTTMRETSDIVAMLAGNHKKGDNSFFFKEWCFYYQEMSLLGWDTTKMLGKYDVHGGWPIAPFRTSPRFINLK